MKNLKLDLRVASADLVDEQKSDHRGVLPIIAGEGEDVSERTRAWESARVERETETKREAGEAYFPRAA